MQQGRRGGSGAISNLPRPHPPAPRRRGPGSEWLRRGRPGAGAGRAPGRGYKGPRRRPRPTLRRRPARPARRPRCSCPGRSPRGAPRAPARPTGPLAGRRARGRARPAARGLRGPSKRSSAIGAGDSRAERPARPPAGLPLARRDLWLDLRAASESGSRQVSAPWCGGGRPSRGPGAGGGGGHPSGAGTAGRSPVLGIYRDRGCHPAGDGRARGGEVPRPRSGAEGGVCVSQSQGFEGKGCPCWTPGPRGEKFIPGEADGRPSWDRESGGGGVPMAKRGAPGEGCPYLASPWEGSSWGGGGQGEE